MKIQFNAKELEKAIAAVNRAISGKPVKEFLNGILIVTDGDKVQLTATNFEMLIRYTIDADVLDAGKALINGKLFHDLIRRMPGPDITISDTKKNRLSVQSGKAVYDILTMNVHEYPDLDLMKADNPITLKAGDLAEMYRKVAFAALEPSLSSGLFSGIHFSIKEGMIAVTATNKHRLSRMVYPFAAELEGEVIIQPKVLAEIASLARPEDSFSMAWNAGKMVVKNHYLYLESRTFSGQFPDVTRVIPKDLPIKMTAKRQELLQAIDRVSLIGVEKLKDVVLNDVKMTVTPGVLFIDASTAQKGAASEELPIELQGEGIEIRFNGNQIMDFLKAVDTDKVVFSFQSPRGAATITTEDDDKLVYVISPIVRKGDDLQEAG